MGSLVPVVSDTRSGRTQIFWLYALVGTLGLALFLYGVGV